MEYIVKLIDYSDKQLDVRVQEEDLSHFLESVKKGDVAWDSEQKKYGFFVDPKNVRFMQLIREDCIAKEQPPSEDNKDALPSNPPSDPE